MNGVLITLRISENTNRNFPEKSTKPTSKTSTPHYLRPLAQTANRKLQPRLRKRILRGYNGSLFYRHRQGTQAIWFQKARDSKAKPLKSAHIGCRFRKM